MSVMATLFAMYGAAQPYSVPFTEDFEGPTVSTNWTMHSNSINTWIIGSATGNQSAKSLYITNNDGSFNGYNNTVDTYTTAYTTIDFGNFADYAISFDWAIQAESTIWDRVEVFLIPEDLEVPTVWNRTVVSGWITDAGARRLGVFYGQSTWQYVRVIVDGSYATNTTKKLVFMFSCNTNTGNGPVSIDNLSIVGNDCVSPTSVVVSDITPIQAQISWSAGSGSSWNVLVSPVPVSDFTVAVPTATAVSAPYYTATGLTANTQYYVYAQTNCGGTAGTSEWTSPVIFRASCTPTLPWSDNFDSYDYTAMPPCWTRSQQYSMTGDAIYPRVSQSNSTRYYSPLKSLHFYSLATGVTEMIASPQFAEEANTLEVSFYLNRAGATAGTFEVGVMSNPSNPSTFYLIQSVTPSVYNTWLFNEISLASAPTGYHYIAFKQVTSGLGGTYNLDDVSVVALPACPKPTNVTVSNITGNSANISWTAGGTESTWNVVVSTVPVTNFTPVIPSTTTNNPYLATGLSPSTLYYVYVQAICDGSTSDWTAAVTFRTYCNTVTSLPWTDNFDSYTNATVPACWMQTQPYTATGGGSAYPRVTNDDHHSGSRSLDFHGHGTEIVATPMFDADVSTLEAGFWLHKEGPNSGTFEVGVMYDPLDPGTFFRVEYVTPDDGTPWVYIEVPLNNAPPGYHYIAFKQVADITGLWYYYLDDVDIHLLPDCVKPRDVGVSNIGRTTAEINWGEGNLETAWNVIISTTAIADFNTVDPALVHTVTVAPGYYAAGLNPGTQYYVYVQADCEGAGTSVWTNAVTFRTYCNAVGTLPWPDGFDSYTNGDVPSCWIQVESYNGDGTGNAYPKVTTAQYHAGGKSLAFVGPVVETVAIPEFTVETNTLGVSFWLKRESSTSGAFAVGVMSDPANPDTFVPIQDVTPGTSDWTYFDISLAEANNGYHYVAFRRTTTSLTYAYWLDDVNVHVLPSCPKPDAVAVSGIGTTTANIGWTAGGTETTWNIVVSTVPLTDFNSASPVVATNPYIATGLTQNTPYYVYVQADCGGTNGTSVWTSAVTFRTHCGALTSSSLVENFDSYANAAAPPCWVQVLPHNGYPRVTNSVNHSSSNSLQFDGTQTQIIATPEFPVEVNTFEVTFWLNKNNTNAGTFEVGVMSDASNPATFVAIQTITPSNTIWNYIEVPLHTASMGNHFIAFRQNFPSSGNYYIDDVNVHLLPPCIKPNSVGLSSLGSTTADISWIAGYTETAWNVVVSTVQLTDPSTASFVTTSNSYPYTITGLTPSTRYYVYVQSNCGTEGTSTWTEAVTFKTLCGAVLGTTWSENFDAAANNSIPDCWTQVETCTSASDIYPMIISYVAHSPSKSLMFRGSQPQSVATPIFDVEAYTMTVDFWFTMDMLNSELEVGVMSDAGNKNTFMLVETVSAEVINTWTHATVSFAYVPEGYHFVVFRQNIAGTDFCRIDDVQIISTPVIPLSVITEAADDITSTGATLHKLVTEGTYPVVSEGFRYKATSATQWSNITTTAAAEPVPVSLTPNTVYEFFAYGSATIGGPVYGDTMTFTTTNGPVPPIVVTDPATSVTQTTATLNKTITANTETITAEGFDYRATEDLNWIDTGANGNLTGLTAATFYDFRAYAIAGSNTYYGNPVTFKTLEHVLPIITTLAATDIECTTATLNKTVVPGTEATTVDGFEYRKVGDNNWSTNAGGNLTGLTQATEYEFRGYVTTVSGITHYGGTMRFITQQCVGYETADDNELLIYPNPANSMVMVNIEGLNTSAKVTVTDVNGKLIETLTINAGDNRAEFDVANYADGTYIVRVISENINRIEKLIVKK